MPKKMKYKDSEPRRDQRQHGQETGTVRADVHGLNDCLAGIFHETKERNVEDMLAREPRAPEDLRILEFLVVLPRQKQERVRVGAAED